MLGPLEIRRVYQAELQAALDLLISNGWQHRLGELSEFTALIAASQIAHVAVVDGKIVGFIRGITDGMSNGYLSMVVVAPPFRGKGIGRGLVDAVTAVHPNVTWVLRAGREGAASFFAKLGFEASAIAMERRRA